MKNFELENRSLVIRGIAIAIVVVYIVRLFTLQIMSDDYRKSADSNAFLKKIAYPSRGVITDRKGQLLVFNQPAYDIMVVMNEAKDHLDTLEFCRSLNITKEFFDLRMAEIKDRNRNPGYSRYTLFALYAAALYEPDQRPRLQRFSGKDVPFSRFLYPATQHKAVQVGHRSPCAWRCC